MDMQSVMGFVFGGVAVTAALVMVVMWVLSVRDMWLRQEQHYRMQDDWHRGLVALSDLSDQWLMEVAMHDYWREELPPSPEYRDACVKELDRRMNLDWENPGNDK